MTEGKVSAEPLWRIRSGLDGRADLGALSSGDELAPGLRLFHDGKAARCTRSGGLTVDATAFTGSYISLAQGIPIAEARQMQPGHLVEVAFRAEASRPTLADIRLNLERGEGLAQIAINRVLSEGGYRCLLDLAHTEIGEVQAVWIDVILRSPEDRVITIRELSIALCPRSAGFDRRYRY